jgi:transcriptional regulator with XRE-family HTH domain
MRTRSAPERQIRSPTPSAREHALPAPAVAGIVKGLRQRAGLTLNQLAQRSQVAASTISKIEAGQLSPGYEIIVRLSHGLRVDVAELFKPHTSSSATGRRGITRKGQGVVYDTARYTYEALANDVARKAFIPLRARIKAHEQLERDPLPAHEGEEWVFVLSGTVTLHSEHYEPLELLQGDSVYFDSRSGHLLISSGAEDAEVIWVCSHRDAMTRMQRE